MKNTQIKQKLAQSISRWEIKQIKIKKIKTSGYKLAGSIPIFGNGYEEFSEV